MQFYSVASVAPVTKTAEPLEAVGLAHDGAGSHHLPTLAPGVAGGTHLIQPAKGWRKIFRLRQSALTGCLTRAINVKDDPGISCSIEQASRLLVVRERATLEILEEEGA